MIIQEILRKTYSAYKLSPLDAEILLSLALKKTKEYILAHPEKKLTKLQEKKFIYFAKRRSSGEPIAYIVGKKEFFGLDFLANKHVLIPRPETELLIEHVLEKIQNTRYKIPDTIIDVGTGSGNIIISIAKNIPSKIKNKMNFYALDISKESLQVAKVNAKRYKLDKKIKFIQSDILEYFLQPAADSPLAKKNKKIKNILIIANLPYLDQKWKNLLDSSESRGLKFEPKIALEGGSDGLDAYRELAKHVKHWKEQYKRINIALFCEIGHIQKNAMKDIFSFVRKIKFHKDLAGKWRMAEIKI